METTVMGLYRVLGLGFGDLALQGPRMKCKSRRALFHYPYIPLHNPYGSLEGPLKSMQVLMGDILRPILGVIMEFGYLIGVKFLRRQCHGLSEKCKAAFPLAGQGPTGCPHDHAPVT